MGLGNKLEDNIPHRELSHKLVKRFVDKVNAINTGMVMSDCYILKKIISLIDLTTLTATDTTENVSRLVVKAITPLVQDKKVHCAAVCVYPLRVTDVKKALDLVHLTDEESNLKNLEIASVATGFPSGMYHIKERLAEIDHSVEDGATEIDIVLNRTLVLEHKWSEIFEEIKQMKESCRHAHLKCILATGELETLQNIYRASYICMMANADFIKTSTGKEKKNAEFLTAIPMLFAIRDFYEKTGKFVGFKAAGGISTTKDAIRWMALVKMILGDQWMKPSLFRFGASSLLEDVKKMFEERFL
ncbi:hypothetical protein SNEBB_002456 [Seison nebaliae]|nr:hypothetical protein SNEBB_002456 [Seison nebaliae]